MRERVEVKVGQWWQSCDKRDPSRRVRIVSLDNRYAYYWNCGHKPRRIRLDRMYPHSTGWRLVNHDG